MRAGVCEASPHHWALLDEVGRGGHESLMLDIRQIEANGRRLHRVARIGKPMRGEQAGQGVCGVFEGRISRERRRHVGQRRIGLAEHQIGLARLSWASA